MVLALPKSKSKRSTYTPPPPAKPKASPRWVPILGITLIGLGALLVLQLYLINMVPGGDANLFVGFGVMAAGLFTLSQWR